MQILFDDLIYHLQRTGGISRYYDELISGFKQTGQPVAILRRPGTEAAPYADAQEIIDIDSAITNGGRLKKYLSIWLDKFRTEQALKRRGGWNNYIFHSGYYRLYRNFTGKSIVTVHDFAHESLPEYFSGWLNWLYIRNKRQVIERADVLIAVSYKTKDDLINFYGLDADKITVIHQGISPIFRRLDAATLSLFRQQKKIVRNFFLVVGGRAGYKNFLFLLETFGRWEQRHNFDLLCIGGGDFSAAEREMIKKLQLSDQVKLLSGVSDADLVGYYNCAQAFIHPSQYEGFGLPILEALACGAPVICSDIPAFREIGSSFPLFFQTATELLAGLEQAENFSGSDLDQAAAWAAKFTWQETVRKTLEVYRRLSSG